MTIADDVPSTAFRGHLDIAELANEAVALVERWLAASAHESTDAAAARLAGVLQDPTGLDFTVGFVDGVVRPEDLHVAARNLRKLTADIPAFLSLPLQALIRVGATLALRFPRLVVPAARAVLRRMVRHLIVDATDRKLGPTIARIVKSDDGIRLNINLLGEAILGEREAARRLEGTRRLLLRSDVDYVSIKVSSTVAPHSPWSFDAAVAHAVSVLTPLYRTARDAGAQPKFINLDMEEYKDLDLTLEVFMRLLDQDEFRGLEAGIVLQAYLPDALAAMMRLQEWAAERARHGGAPIKVRVVKGANLPMEQVDADIHGWPLATWASKQESDSSYKAVLDYALRPERTRNVRIGVAGHNLFDIALAWLLAQRRHVTDGIEFEMLLGMATAQAAVVRREVGSLLLYTPVVHPKEFDVAIAYLIRRLEEGASHENFMSALFELDKNQSLFQREKERFLASVRTIPEGIPKPNRVQDRTAPASPGQREPFVNTPDTDTALAVNRHWGDGIRDRMSRSTLGVATAEASLLREEAQLDQAITRGVASGEAWRNLGADRRAQVLHRAGDALQARRAELLEVMGSECGKVLEQGDPEVSEAIDFAHYYAEAGRALERFDGARPVPVRMTVVTPPWNFPVAIPAGGVFAALAAGSPVIIKPARQARRCGAVLVEALWEAGVPRDVLQYVQLADNELGARLIAHECVDRVILTGGYETAQVFRGIRPDLRLLAETSGKNALIVTPSADLDLAAKDVAASAFGHAGQKCSAASIAILVGSVARSERFRRQLIDAVSSMRVGLPWDEDSQIGPLICPAAGKLEDALTNLGAGESWLVSPHRRDADGALWRPGVREGVRPGSEFHLTEYFGPVLGIMTAETLDEAIDMSNQIEYGLTSGLHALDETEIATWMRRIEAGNLYVNRGTTGAIVQRQPFGGWKKAAVGAGAKAGGPNYLVGLVDWVDDSAAAPDQPDACAAVALAAGAEASLSESEMSWLAAASESDRVAWETEFGIVRDVTGLQSEINAFRYHPVPVTVRFEGGRIAQLLRVVVAGIRAHAPVTVSAAEPLPISVQAYLDRSGAQCATEGSDDWGARVARLRASGGRVRLIGADARAFAALSGGDPTIAMYDGAVVTAGRVEMLPFVREQSVTVTAHRFGTPHRYEIPPTVVP